MEPKRAYKPRNAKNALDIQESGQYGSKTTSLYVDTEESVVLVFRDWQAVTLNTARERKEVHDP